MCLFSPRRQPWSSLCSKTQRSSSSDAFSAATVVNPGMHDSMQGRVADDAIKTQVTRRAYWRGLRAEVTRLQEDSRCARNSQCGHLNFRSAGIKTSGVLLEVTR